MDAMESKYQYRLKKTFREISGSVRRNPLIVSRKTDSSSALVTFSGEGMHSSISLLNSKI